ncbi:MAG: hypothetical protein LBU13_08905 [Synergistaceae bacterium]|jgi:hypothetical protein|nr:hypothetical protein [Synergistaceae bacterium]
MMITCPGSDGLKGTPKLKIKKCPECGADVEVFSNSFKTNCVQCGFPVYNDAVSCISWCKYARDCVGNELHEQFMGDRGGGAGIEENTAITSPSSAVS